MSKVLAWNNFHFELFDPPAEDWKRKANQIAAKSGKPIPFMGQFNRAWDFGNGMTTVGGNNMLAAQFNGGAQVSTWTMGLIDGSGSPSLATADTMASHSGWSELTTYSQSPRPTWVSGSPSGLVIVNASPVQFSITGSVTAGGAFLVNTAQAPGDTTGILFCTGLFTSGQSLINGQNLNVTYSVTLTT